MCSPRCIVFGSKNLKETEVKGASVIEIGSRNVNGGLRQHIESLNPVEYIGVDIVKGNGVDVICDAENIVAQFGPERFDIVVSTEMLEHGRNWRSVIWNMKTVLRPGGIILITTRAPGFGYHGFPDDYWRFTVTNMEAIFSDFNINELEWDTPANHRGVFVKATKSKGADLEQINLFSIITEKPQLNISNIEIAEFLKSYDPDK